MKKKEWLKREFNNILDPGTFPGILERLIGTSARMDEKLSTINSDLYEIKLDGNWSIKENVGHLADLEPLWAERIEDFVNGEKTLRKADLDNQKTNLANHNSKSIPAILAAFRKLRNQFTESLSNLKNSDFEKTCLHPRLKTPMKIIDLAHFVAEHDDHHLAQITLLANQLSDQSS